MFIRQVKWICDNCKAEEVSQNRGTDEYVWPIPNGWVKTEICETSTDGTRQTNRLYCSLSCVHDGLAADGIQ